MAILILDLDLTVFACNQDAKEVHQNHTLKFFYATARGDQIFNVWLINPCELSELIETACMKYDGVMILTSGGWPASILEHLAANLDLSEKASQKLLNAYFHSAISDQVYCNEPVQVVKEMAKSTRLKNILKYRPELKEKHFVMLDDNQFHIESFQRMDNVIPVLATTDEESKGFYQRVIEALKEAHRRENGDEEKEKLPMVNASSLFFAKTNKKRSLSDLEKENKNESGSVKRPRTMAEHPYCHKKL